MKILAFGDNLITPEMLRDGLKAFEKKGDTVEIRDWSHKNVEDLQNDNIKIEQSGASAVEINDSKLLDSIETFDLIITQFTPISKNIIDRAKKLKYIGVLRGGVENVDESYAKSKGVKVINTGGRNARAVAEFTVGMILSETRNIARTSSEMHKGIWYKDFPNKNKVPEIGGKTVGIIGFGHIGQLVAQFLKGFNANIIFYDPYVNEKEDFKKVDNIEDLVKQSTIVTIHMRADSTTHHIIDQHIFELMDENTYFINTARSALVDESALIKALKENKIAGAAIDTFEDEPLPKNSPFLSLQNVTLTSHLAGTTVDAFKNSPKLFADRFLNSVNN
ncbi:2-hydroxyacid dehydrogenase [Tetragenococcus koreensis]|uniref:D-3-phosphoglycerate dehydrogenase n=1 Tax=Tetragenococcus koreensis TaxID=290335 RepID=A0AAN4UCW0_9ENTE|nr:2-hydroxyacid dehydrogenase [Tetragenococcus koreensis]GEQ50151.1 D-3-phosphoglycerate dehydrogenase [Tetragenococcus koreensis]GEQ52599.1 D-3-phosphoglycerate dehydrogenase [Tetragenococcus koreensis]GEQ55134.1 D-3-phosphoglycerate dehydrogenase [Tetragenococcus koreensis]GEQ57600.1 D-3-phosphoglycerate dehydrogenase [Tetragenococcus koreensis]GEQ60165.1 D-3-phosphoglycerate dehydrogenase [Tetragenococcus koreensis]